jgi:hypothetical protein
LRNCVPLCCIVHVVWVDAVRCATAAAGGLPLCGWAWGWRLAAKDCGMPLAARRALRCAGDGVGGKRPGEIPGHYLSVAKRHTAVRCLRCTSARPPTPAASMGGRRSSEGTTTWEGGGVHACVRQRRMNESESRRSHLCACWCQICRQAQVESECALQAGLTS